MAYATQSRRAAQGASPWQWLADVREALATRAAQYRTFRTTLSELEGLTDRDLADLGVHRADIRGIARDAAYGR